LSLEHLLIPHHIESVVEVLWVYRPLTFFLFLHPLLGTISIVLLTLLPLVISFAISRWFVVTNIKDQISSLWRKDQKSMKA
jgi:antibiotic biosynthesis monooxygenase (ABM) superfamily enzyme